MPRAQQRGRPPCVSRSRSLGADASLQVHRGGESYTTAPVRISSSTTNFESKIISSRNRDHRVNKALPDATVAGPDTSTKTSASINLWYELQAFVVARVVPAVADIERGVVGEAPGPASELLELLSEGVVPGARLREVRVMVRVRPGLGFG